MMSLFDELLCVVCCLWFVDCGSFVAMCWLCAAVLGWLIAACCVLCVACCLPFRVCCL